jgi:hypothetical protein
MQGDLGAAISNPQRRTHPMSIGCQTALAIFVVAFVIFCWKTK